MHQTVVREVPSSILVSWNYFYGCFLFSFCCLFVCPKHSICHEIVQILLQCVQLIITADPSYLLNKRHLHMHNCYKQSFKLLNFSYISSRICCRFLTIYHETYSLIRLVDYTLSHISGILNRIEILLLPHGCVAK